jgi:precorrin-8X/cobalt-precorrin-8 methylmutase
MIDFKTEFKPYTIQPQKIEGRSFEIIDEEIGSHSYTAEQYPIVQRVIHSTADFELGKSLRFHHDAIQAGIRAIKTGKKIVTDIKMVSAGINKRRIEKFGCSVHEYITDEGVVKEARALNVTRSIVAMRKGIKEAEGGIFAIGNAPTALLELIRLIKQGAPKPGLIIGFPVGFVSATESKEELMKLDIPFITNQGRKGGSTVAVAAVNAIAIMAERVE